MSGASDYGPKRESQMVLAQVISSRSIRDGTHGLVHYPFRSVFFAEGQPFTLALHDSRIQFKTLTCFVLTSASLTWVLGALKIRSPFNKLTNHRLGGADVG